MTLQSYLQGVRDFIQIERIDPASPLRQGYATSDLADPALGYGPSKGRSQNPLASMAASSNPPVRYAVWGQGFIDREWRDVSRGGVDFGRSTSTSGGLVGVDAIITGVWVPKDALVVGMLGGETHTRMRNNDGTGSRIEGPGAGIYAAYVVGGFSVDAAFKVDFLDMDLRTRTTEIPLSITNYIFAMNLSHRQHYAHNWWFEPTIGFSHTTGIWDDSSAARGYEDNRELRVTGGVRMGTSFTWNSVQIQPTLGLMAYLPVHVEGGPIRASLATITAPTDEGVPFGQATAKMNFVWTNQFSSYVEGEVRGTEDVLGAAGRLGLRYSFQ